MRNKFYLPVVILIFLAIAASACSTLFPAVSGNQNSAEAQQTQVMSTVSAVLTQQAFNTLVAQATQSAIQAQATATPQATATMAPPTATSIPPTATMVPPTPTNTPIPTPCNWAKWISDVTIPDGTTLSAGQQFTKTWRLKNIGTCTWTTAYDLVFVSGSSMSGPAAVDFKANVAPGESVDLSVSLIAPTSAGSYKGFWELRDGSGVLFGLGSNAKDSFWVSINVSGYHSDNVPTSIYPYDFTATICQATWDSNAGNVTLPCPNVVQNQPQWAAVLMTPKFENGSQENERTIWMHINNPNDYLQGFFPATTIQSGNHFIAWIGCLYGNNNCTTTFSLDYKVDNGSVANLGKWNETYDGKITKIDIDLSQFAGKSVQFILGASNKNASGPLDVFWFVPSIQLVSSSS